MEWRAVERGEQCLVVQSEKDGDVMITKQSFRDQCDVNTIMAKYKRTGTLDHVSGETPAYGDFSNVTDYQSAMNQIIEANVAFEQLPATTRARFHNNPEELVTFMEDSDNQQEAEDLGLVPKAKTVPEPPEPEPDPEPDPPE